MFSTLLTEIRGLVDKRFLLSAFFPVLLFGFGADLLIASAHGGIDDQIAAWKGYSGLFQGMILGGALAGVFLLAAVLSSSSILITQLYEGYRGFDWLKKIGIWRQAKRAAETTGNKELRFPLPNLQPNTAAHLQPTALGNVLRAAEEYPQRAYGANVVVVWPRLFLVLPPELVLSATGPADAIQLLLNVSLLATVYGVLGGAYVAAESLGAAAYLATVFGALAVARVAYRGAVEAAIEYGLHIRGAFDVHRTELLSKLHRALPTSRDEELRTWKDVSERLQTGEPRPVRYVAPSAK